MVARYSDGPKYSGHAEAISWVLAEAEQLRESCTDLIAADAEAFGAVAAAYKLPKDTADLADSRAAAIAAALTGAAEPPTAVIKAGARLIALANTLRQIGNRSVIADIAAAAEAIRAAVATARLNLQVNLRGMTDDAAKARFTDVIDLADHVATKATGISVAVLADLDR